MSQKLYRERREKGLRGQLGYATVHRPVLTQDAGPQLVPLGNKTGNRLSRGKHSEKRSNLRQQWRAYNRQQRKASARGE